MLTTALAGFGLGLSLIVAIGSQNLFVLRQGLRREYVVVVAVICAASDAALIALGVSGVGLALQSLPWLIDVVRWVGAAFLIGYGLLAARRAWRPTGDALAASDATETGAGGPAAGDAVAGDAAGTGAAAPEDAAATGASPFTTASATIVAPPARPRARITPVVLTCLALTWLNPHVYLDTVFLLGSVANTHGDLRWVFAGGAMIASVVWFFGLALGARYLSRWLATPRAWRVLDAVIAVVMIALGVSLVIPHL